MQKHILKFYSVDNGYCRVYYKTEKGALYCLQVEDPKGQDIRFYNANNDYGEPEYTCKLDNVFFESFKDDTITGKQVLVWLNDNKKLA